MIKNFSVFYCGQVDHPEYGANGPEVNDRFYSPDEIASIFETAEITAKHIDDLGYYALWFAEHHFQREGYECIPNIPHLASYLSAKTQNIKFGCAFNIATMWHPIRLAEDFAMADILSKGRTIFGLGRGYHTREGESLGIPILDTEANFELFQEQVDIILKAFSQDSFSHEGKHYTIPPRVPYRDYTLEEVTLVPRPINRPVEIWQPVASERSLEFLVKSGFKAVFDRNGEVVLEQAVRKYTDLCHKHGRNIQLGGDAMFGVGWLLADSQKEATRRLNPYHEEFFKFAAPFGWVQYADENGARWGTPPAPTRIPTIEDSVQQRAWFAGSPGEFIDFLREWEERYPGLENVLLNWPYGQPRDEYMEQLTIFAKKVMPAFQREPAKT